MTPPMFQFTCPNKFGYGDSKNPMRSSGVPQAIADSEKWQDEEHCGGAAKADIFYIDIGLLPRVRLPPHTRVSQHPDRPPDDR